MRPVIILIITTLTFGIALFMGIAVIEPVADTVQDDTDGYDGTIDNIEKAALKYSVPMFFFSMFGWGMFWYLRRERSTRRI